MSRKNKIKKQRKSTILKKVLFIFFLCIACFFILTSELFSVETVMVENNTVFSQEDIEKMSGITLGTNTFKIKTNDISQRIKDNPYIKDVQVKRKLPGGIAISIEERKEAASVFFLDQCVVLDEEGYVLSTVESNPYLTIIDGLKIKDFSIGEKLKIENQEVLDDVLNVIIKMNEYELFFKKIKIEDQQLNVAIYDKLFCKTNSDMLINNMQMLGEIIYDLHKKGIKRGIIRVGGDGYFSYSPTD